MQLAWIAWSVDCDDVVRIFLLHSVGFDVHRALTVICSMVAVAVAALRGLVGCFRAGVCIVAATTFNASRLTFAV